MTKKKRAFLITICILSTIFLAIFGGYVGIFVGRRSRLNTIDFSVLNGSANKVVLFIGDGMGENHIKVTSSYYEKQMFMTTLDYKGKMSTFSNAVFFPTDSAAAASAMATGQKYNNKEVSRHNNVDINSISEYAKQKGYGVGIVTTDNLYGATPAGFSSHADKRGNTEQIILGQLENNFDLYLGAGKTTYENYKDLLKNMGYNYQNDISLLEITNEKIFGVFSSIVASGGNNTTPTLEMLTSFAVDYFETNFPNGYFLMIEGAHIDKKSHSNQIFEMMDYLNSFDESIKVCYGKLAMQDNVSIIVTADHETGGLKFNNQTREQIDNSLYTRLGHSAKDVPYFIYYKTSKDIDFGSIIKKRIDNTDIFKLCKSLIGD